MNENIFSEEIRQLFHSIYNNDQNKLKLVAPELLKKGFGYIQILQLTTTELKIDLGKAIMLLEIPDYMG